MMEIKIYSGDDLYNLVSADFHSGEKLYVEWSDMEKVLDRNKEFEKALIEIKNHRTLKGRFKKVTDIASQALNGGGE